MPYADPEERKACAKRYRSKPETRTLMNQRQRDRVARLMEEDPIAFREQRRVWARSHYHKSRMKTILREARKRAKEKGVPFDLTEADIDVPEFCPVFGCRLEVGSVQRRNESPSLDRVIPALGYVKGNVRVISWRANRLKCNASIAEMEAILSYMKGGALLGTPAAPTFRP